MPCNDLLRLDLGTLPDNVYPQDDCRVYIYKRTNGHIYIFRDGNETHICCDLGLINKVPILSATTTDSTVPDVSVLDTPDLNHRFLFSFNNYIYVFNNDRTYSIIGGGSTGFVDWTLKEW